MFVLFLFFAVIYPDIHVDLTIGVVFVNVVADAVVVAVDIFMCF